MRTAATSGAERIAEAFARAHASGRRAALMPYLMGGYPDLDTSREIGLAYARSGADLIELGVPFSDPLADGPVIHAAATAALASGATLPAVLEIGRAIAAEVPVVLMCYFNVILARGVERCLDDVAAIGASGVIIPDLPLEESDRARKACTAAGLALIPLVAPTTPEARLARIGAGAQGFLYTVALTGTTGERSAARADRGLAAIVARAAAHSAVPVAVGFGIGTPEQAAAAAAAGADGVIVGSRLVRAAGMAEDPVAEVSGLVAAFAAALGDGHASGQDAPGA